MAAMNDATPCCAAIPWSAVAAVNGLTPGAALTRGACSRGSHTDQCRDLPCTAAPATDGAAVWQRSAFRFPSNSQPSRQMHARMLLPALSVLCCAWLRRWPQLAVAAAAAAAPSAALPRDLPHPLPCSLHDYYPFRPLCLRIYPPITWDADDDASAASIFLHASSASPQSLLVQ